MMQNNLIERSREIQKQLKTEINNHKRLNFSIDNYEQRIRYAFYNSSGKPVILKELFASYISDVRETNLYVHVPFCTKRCSYCCYYSLDKQPRSILLRYIDSLKKELELLHSTSRFDQTVIKHVYFGGGTPSILPARQLEDFIQHLRRNFSFLPDINFTCEISPETTVENRGKEKLQVLFENGVNRLSIGVQSFDDDVLESIGRNHSATMAKIAYKNAVDAGFENINIDMMYGLPGQTLKSWEYDLKFVTDLRPGWISLSRLRFDNPEIYKTYVENRNAFPDPDTVFLMNIMGCEKMDESGYLSAHAPVSFCLPSKTQFSPRHWFGEQEVSIGAGVRSYLNGVRYINVRHLKKYIELLNKGCLPVSFAGKYSKKQQVEKEIILMLRMSGGIVKKQFNTRFGIDIEKMFENPLNLLRKLEMITDDKERIRLSSKGILFAAEVFKQFYTENLMDKFKNMVYHNSVLRRMFLKQKYSGYIENLTTVVKRAVSGFKIS